MLYEQVYSPEGREDKQTDRLTHSCTPMTTVGVKALK